VKSNPEGVHGFLPRTVKIISSADPRAMEDRSVKFIITDNQITL
jgi:hypothetical protein